MQLNVTDHYENFPVGSILLPSRLRKPIAIIYQFARSADDIADEGSIADDERLKKLNVYLYFLNIIKAGKIPDHPFFAQLREIIAFYDLPIQLFIDLIDAFSQDVVKKRYRDFEELLDYSRRSANPIGRLLLHLFKENSEQNLLWSDAICSSLQLINFWQDIAIDWQKNRVYIPLNDMEKYGVTEEHIAAKIIDDSWKTLFQFQVDRSRQMLESGSPLGRVLSGRVGLEIRATIASGLKTAAKLKTINGDIYTKRPTLDFFDWPQILYRAIFPKRFSHTS